MLVKPASDYPRTEGKSCVCLEEGQYRVYLDRDAALELLFSLHWFAMEAPIGEEVDIGSRNCGELPCKGRPIGLCELNLVPAHRHQKPGKNKPKTTWPVRHKPHGIYSEANDRLDYFVSVEEVQDAYRMLTSLLVADEQERRRMRETTLFETLVVRLVNQ
jgi:hypothetical protein